MSEPEETLGNIAELVSGGSLTLNEAIRRAFDYGKTCGGIEALAKQIAELDKVPS